MEDPLKHFARKRGFSLVELLVVIAIIGVLVAILMPSIARAPRRRPPYTVHVKCADTDSRVDHVRE